MVLKVLLKFPPALALAHGCLFPETILIEILGRQRGAELRAEEMFSFSG